jgi:hypothetical protein
LFPINESWTIVLTSENLKMLHITNGDSAVHVMLEAGLAGTVLPWRDILHEGPVPDRLDLSALREVRSRFLASRQWADYEGALRSMAERDAVLEAFCQQDETVLWFEHDLYDQLQLIQILDWFSTQELGNTRLSMVCRDEYLGNMNPNRILELFPLRTAVTSAQLKLATRSWAAFRSDDPGNIQQLLSEVTSDLPFLKAALTRHLQQFPSIENGLSRSEQQAVQAIADGKQVIKGVYISSHHGVEDPIFLGDSTFAGYLVDLSDCPSPLVTFGNGERIERPAANSRDFFDQKLVLTETGRRVLNCDADRIALNGIDRWYGGVHLTGDTVKWRWDQSNMTIRHMN